MLHLHMLWFLCALLGYFADPASAEIEYNTINEDGSFQFRHANDDIGGYYHSASGTPDNTVRGRYGSRSPASGQIEETVYTAGPRGFRVNGPKIHRKMDLAQYPVRPRGSLDDPLADPFDDPSYSFSFRTPDQSRSEENDSGNRIRGLYSYLDDVGERHSVRYAAGAGTGFEISNAVPDNPSSVAYSSPLYKAPPRTRGKMSVQRGPAGSYKLIAAGPDHRRAESRAPDGLVRGTYSFLDDKGVQRTVEYIAGAGIGYRVVHNRIGPGTHINPSVADFRLADTDFRLANDFGRGAGGGLGVATGSASGGSGSGPSGAGVGGGGGGGRGRAGSRTGATDYLKPSGGNRGGGGGGAGGKDEGEAADGDGAAENDLGLDDNGGGNQDDDIGLSSGSSGSSSFRGKEDRRGYPAGSSQRGSTRYDAERGGGGAVGGAGGRGGTRTGGGSSVGGGATRQGGGASTRINASGTRNRNRFSGGSSERGGGGGGGSTRRGGSASSEGDSSLGYLPPTGGGGGGGGTGSAISGPGDNYNLNDDDVGSSLPPLVTANHRILEIDRDREWVQRHRDSTVIKNVGKWYVGLPPGQSVRAHVQNIDIVPLGGRVGLSPSEALRQDEIADLAASREH
ncbi:fibroin heavy chain [Drosophila persimilis]|uniref:fibroin heavy chain n=1 Tax=Drosophila persimilis TaxID=7234 RepID=UPI000F0850CB|nr:fibroin heavy chain [Drosophila persimilis]